MRVLAVIVCPPVGLSVRPPVTRWYCVNRAKHTITQKRQVTAQEL